MNRKTLVAASLIAAPLFFPSISFSAGFGDEPGVATAPASPPASIVPAPITVSRDDAAKVITINVNPDKIEQTGAPRIAFPKSKEAKPAVPSDPLADEERRLNDLPAFTVNTREKAKTTLHSLIRQLCQVADMQVAIPVPDDFAEAVSVSFCDNPYRILRTLATTYGFEMANIDGVWRFHKPDIGELVQRTYKIKYYDLSQTEITTVNISRGLGGGNNGSYGSSRGNSGGISSGNSGGAGGISSANSGQIKNTQKLVEALGKILEMPTTGLLPNAQDGEQAVGRFVPIESSRFKPAVKPVTVKGTAEYIPATRSLVVRGTRMQHACIERFLSSFDIPTEQVEFGVQFVEITGLDNIKKGADLTGFGATTVTIDSGANDRDHSLTTNPALSDGSFQSPKASGAIFSVSKLSMVLNFLQSETGAVTADAPRIVTRDNCEVTFSNTTKVPVLSAENNFNAGSSVNSTQSVDYLEIGTILKIVPHVVAADPKLGNGQTRNIALECSISSSSQAGTTTIAGNPYPVVRDKSYACQVTVPDGYTLAVSGLRQTKESTNDIGLWPLSKIPWLGWHVFTFTSVEKSDSSVLAFITTKILAPTDLDGTNPLKAHPKKNEALAAVSTGVSWTGDLEHDTDVERVRAILFPKQGGLDPKAPEDAAALAPTPKASEKAPEIDQTQSALLAQEAIRAKEAGNLPLAREKAETLLDLDPSNTAAQQFLAEVKASILARERVEAAEREREIERQRRAEYKAPTPSPAVAQPANVWTLPVSK